MWYKLLAAQFKKYQNNFLQKMTLAGKSLRRKEKMLHIFVLRAFTPLRQPFFAPK